MAYIHTALRIFDEHRSIAFYQHLGFKELKRDIISPNEVNIRMGLPEDGAEPSLELMVDYKRTEPYQIGNGYGHFGISAPNLEGALAKLAANGIYPEQEP